MAEKKISTVVSLLIILAFVTALPAARRQIISLDGTWQIAQGDTNSIPGSFDSSVPVPGLVDLAKPAFEKVGQKSTLRNAFWYRRTFTLDKPVPAVAQLKIHKAKYGTRVFLNGRLVGDHLPCFVPAILDVKPFLKGPGIENELIIRVGANLDSIPKHIVSGVDLEKKIYHPGIYDSVELIMSETPNIIRVQTVPQIETNTLRVVALIENQGYSKDVTLDCRILEAATGKLAGEVKAAPVHINKNSEKTVEVTIPIENCRLWSPEDPFLYKLEASTDTDTLNVRFGMRSFRFDKDTGRAVLNGKPYFMRGTNTCVQRFFEDPLRGDKPWDEQWVRKLHRKIKSMHWNSIRYCICPSPEMWYRIADEEGLLIQDEYPIWYGHKMPKELTAEHMIKEYTVWIQEHWNYPCVVIWDAQNETYSEETAKVINAVRHLDLSDRPWDNGRSPAQRLTDPFETHPYVRQRRSFLLEDFSFIPGTPKYHGGLGRNDPPNTGNNPVILNEYGWLWLNRDGTPTTLSKPIYERLLPPNPSAELLRYTYARRLAAMTEFWRCRRKLAGIMQFCGLAYSRRGGQTCDNFLDIEKLNFEPNFENFVRDSFAPVGLMIEAWDEFYPAGKNRKFDVTVINDLYLPYSGPVKLRILRDGKTLQQKTHNCRIDPLGQTSVSFDMTIPARLGKYQMVAELTSPENETVSSWRDFTTIDPAEYNARDGIAVGKTVTASSAAIIEGEKCLPAYAADGKRSTRWISEDSDDQWLAIDLGSAQTVSGVELIWEWVYGRSYAIEVSLDGKNWKQVYETDSGQGWVADVINFEPIKARWVRFNGKKRSWDRWGGYAILEMKVFN